MMTIKNGGYYSAKHSHSKHGSYAVKSPLACMLPLQHRNDYRYFSTDGSEVVE